MNKLEVHDRVRIIDPPPDRPNLLNQTGTVLSKGKYVPEALVYVKLDKSESELFFKADQLEKIEQ